MTEASLQSFDKRATIIASKDQGLALEYSKTSAQILIRWSLQHGLVAIPKSVVDERIRENSQVFDFNIADGDMAVLDCLDENLRLNWDPTDVP